jgi:hypothetical protein
MPLVNAYYKFTKAAAIDQINWIKLQNQAVDFREDRDAPNEYSGVVKGIYVSNEMEVEVYVEGSKNAAWEITVEVVEATKTGVGADGKPEYVETGSKVPLKAGTIKKTLPKGGKFHYEEVYVIAWPGK